MSPSGGLGGQSERGASLDGATLAAFALVVIIGGANGVAIRYSLRDGGIEPFWGAAARFLLASIIFFLIAAALRAPIPRGQALTGALLFGTLTFGGGFAFGYWGLQRTPAGLAQVILASIPLFTFALAILHRQERFRWDGLAGALIATGGIAVIFISAALTDVPALSVAAILAGSVCISEAAVIAKRFPQVHPASMNAIAMGAGGSMLLVMSVIAGEHRGLPRTPQARMALPYLVVVGSLGVFSLYLFILRRWTASAAMYQWVLDPVVAVLLSAWLLEEQITSTFGLGAALVLVGVYLGALRRGLG